MEAQPGWLPHAHLRRCRKVCLHKLEACGLTGFSAQMVVKFFRACAPLAPLQRLPTLQISLGAGIRAYPSMLFDTNGKPWLCCVDTRKVWGVNDPGRLDTLAWAMMCSRPSACRISVSAATSRIFWAGHESCMSAVFLLKGQIYLAILGHNNWSDMI